MTGDEASAAYYAGAYRLERDGIPCRVAPWVAELTENGRNMLLRGQDAPGLCPIAQAMRHAQTTYLPPPPKPKPKTK